MSGPSRAIASTTEKDARLPEIGDEQRRQKITDLDRRARSASPLRAFQTASRSQSSQAFQASTGRTASCLQQLVPIDAQAIEVRPGPGRAYRRRGNAACGAKSLSVSIRGCRCGSTAASRVGGCTPRLDETRGKLRLRAEILADPQAVQPAQLLDIEDRPAQGHALDVEGFRASRPRENFSRSSGMDQPMRPR
jgi:hypothetical protein